MAFSCEEWLIGTGLLLLLSVLASRVSDKLGIPALLLFLALGMLAGSDGPGGIYFDDAQLAQGIGVVALAFILFAGGLDTEWHLVRPVIAPALALAVGGVLITALLVGLLAVWVVHLSLLQGLLLGAIVSATDAAAVFAVLRSSGIHLRGQLQPLIELESGSNDPMAVFLTIGLVRLITNPQTSGLDLIAIFFQQMLLGAVLGLIAGLAIASLINHIQLHADGLYPVLLVALVLLTYGTTTFLGGSGFLAVYLAGLVVGNRELVQRRSLLHFQDGLAWLMQIVMFLVLGLLVFPSRLIPIIGSGLLLALFLVLIARPISVFVALSLAPFDRREKTLVSWVGLRGAVPIILATFPLLAGVPQADILFDLVFFIVLTSALLQGPLIVQVARWLGLEGTQPTAEPLEVR